jgi:hypothetical protein
MERQPYYQSDADKSSSKDSGEKKADGFSFAPIPITPSFERYERPAPTPRPVEVPLEGVINWRHDEDLRHRPDLDQAKENNEEHAEDDAESDDDTDNDTSESAKAKRAAALAADQARRQHEAVSAPRPLDEVIAEIQAQQHSAEVTENDMFDIAQPEHVVTSEGVQLAEQAPVEADIQEQPSIPARPVPPLGGFPPVAPRTAEFVTVDSSQETTGNTNVPLQGAAVGPNPNMPPASPAQPNPNAANFNQPPVAPGYNYNQAPYNPYNPVYAQYNTAPVSPTPNAAPVMPIERPGLPTANHDPRVAPVAALLGLEYLARKRADRKLEKRVTERTADQQDNLQEQITADNRILQERQRQFAAEQERQAAEVRHMQHSQEYNAPQPAERPMPGGLPRPFEAAPSGAERFAPNTVQEARTMPGRPAEQIVARPEQRPTPAPTPEQANENADIYDIHPDQHVEHSSWHNIVVDEHGHEVAGAIRYGEGFQRERQQEIVRDRVADGAAGGGMIAAGSPMQDPYGNPMLPGTSLPSGMTNPALPQGQPTHADTNHQLRATNKQPSNLTNPWFWIMLALIAAAFFTAATV